MMSDDGDDDDIDDDIDDNDDGPRLVQNVILFSYQFILWSRMTSMGYELSVEFLSIL